LLGANGAAAIFGPQKGASGKDVQLLEAGLTTFSDVVFNKTRTDISVIKHGGAAGGVAASMYALLNARLVNGIDHFFAITEFENELKKATIVITGEGSIDEQTLQGKGPFGVAKRAKQFSLPVIVLAGLVEDAIGESCKQYFDRLISINEGEPDMENAMKNTYLNLIKTSRQLGDSLSLLHVQN
jgi:glycerate kinase